MTIACTDIQIGINVMLVGLVIWNIFHALRLRREYTKLAGEYRQLADAYVTLEKDRKELVEDYVHAKKLLQGFN